MAGFITFAGVRIVTASIAVPLYGLWSGDIQLATTDMIPSTGALVLGNLSLAGAVYREAPIAGERRVRLVGGFGGWHKTVAKRFYKKSSGIKVYTILNDAAAEVGERIAAPDTDVGQFFVREEQPASRLIRTLIGLNWHVDTAGTVQTASWPSKRIGTPFQVISQDGGRGKVLVSTEDYASWLPGNTFTAPILSTTYTIGGAIFGFDADGKSRVEVLTQ